MKIKSSSAINNVLSLKLGKPADPEDNLTPAEAAQVCKGEAQLRRGSYVTLEQIEFNLDRKARQRGRKTAL
jgi:hypothetical protein